MTDDADGARLRVLVLAEQCNPEWPSLPVVGYKYAVALSEVADVVVVTQIRNEANIRKARSSDTPHLRFHFVDTEFIAGPMHRVASALRGGPEVGWSTGMAMSYPPYLAFERETWKAFRGALRSGDFDVVHRVTPMSPTLPSWIAGRFDQPFVIGPLNGNLDWPPAYADEQKRERERLRVLRSAYKFLPYSRRTWRHSDRVLAAFQHTVDDLDQVPPDRIVMFPEVGYDEEIFYPADTLESAPDPSDGLTFLYAGRLVPYKLPEVVVRAFLGSPTLRAGHRLRVVGDGPERDRLQTLLDEAGNPPSVTLEGRRDQDGVAAAMRESEVFVFPSIRELGAGVVVEAMACGNYCVVVDYGGPAYLVDSERGHKVPLAPLEELVAAFRAAMESVADPGRAAEVLRARRRAVEYARDNYRWQSKARFTEQLYRQLLADRQR